MNIVKQSLYVTLNGNPISRDFSGSEESQAERLFSLIKEHGDLLPETHLDLMRVTVESVDSFVVPSNEF